MLAFLLFGSAPTSNDGVAVQFPQSNVEVLLVQSEPLSDYDVIDQRQGATYYSDCLTYLNRGDVAIKRVQFSFALISGDGQIQGRTLPVDVVYKVAPKDLRTVRGACRKYAYANGERGFKLVAWADAVDFADGTSWRAPTTGSEMTNMIRQAVTDSTSH